MCLNPPDNAVVICIDENRNARPWNRHSPSWRCGRHPRAATRRGSFTSIRQLTDTIGAFMDSWNDHPHPFASTKDAEKIVGKIQRAKTKTSALTCHCRV